jgi:hypothetical protein
LGHDDDDGMAGRYCSADVGCSKPQRMQMQMQMQRQRQRQASVGRARPPAR